MPRVSLLQIKKLNNQKPSRIRPGFSLHGIGGFDKVAGAQVLGLPADHTLQMLVTVGKRGDAATLPDALREREAPNARKPLTTLAKRGSF